jgi:mono/diheme cytochrome c family protein
VTRLHALWTIDGLDATDATIVSTGLRDRSPQVRAAAVRIAEPLLRLPDASTTAEVARLVGDGAPTVRRQLAASLGEMPIADRENAFAMLVARSGNDPIVADLIVSGLPKRELAFLEHTLADTSAASGATIRALVTAVLRARDTAGVQRVLSWAMDPQRARWQSLALLDGLVPGGGRFGGGGVSVDGAPPVGRGGGGGGGRGGFGGGRGGGGSLSLSAAPTALLAAAEGGDSVLAGRARRVAAVLDWPGKPRPVAPEMRPLTADEQRRFAEGQQVFTSTCAGCHQPNGEGRTGVAKSLVGSQWALAPAPQVTRIVLHGKEGQMLMPPVGRTMTDEQVAAVLTYVRRSWGNTATPISPTDVQEARGSSGARKRPWTEAELSLIRR